MNVLTQRMLLVLASVVFVSGCGGGGGGGGISNSLDDTIESGSITQVFFFGNSWIGGYRGDDSQNQNGSAIYSEFSRSLTERLGLIIEDHADQWIYGTGAADPRDLERQLGWYFTDHGAVADPDALYVMWFTPGFGWTIAEAVDRLIAGIQELADAGANKFLVMQVEEFDDPDFSSWPSSWNDGLESDLARLDTVDLSIVIGRTPEYYEYIKANQDTYGITEFVVACDQSAECVSTSDPDVLNAYYWGNEWHRGNSANQALADLTVLSMQGLF